MGPALPGVGLTIEDGELTVAPASVPTFFLGYLGEQAVRAARTARWQVRDRRAGRHLARPATASRRDEDGWLYFEGRGDDVIVSAGYRIGPFEVESALVAHPAVAEAAAVAAPDEERGAVVRAVVVLRDGHAPSAGAGRRAAGARQERDRPVQVPAHRRLRRGAAEDGLGEGQARGAARGLRCCSAARGAEAPAPGRDSGGQRRERDGRRARPRDCRAPGPGCPARRTDPGPRRGVPAGGGVISPAGPRVSTERRHFGQHGVVRRAAPVSCRSVVAIGAHAAWATGSPACDGLDQLELRVAPPASPARSGPRRTSSAARIPTATAAAATT